MGIKAPLAEVDVALQERKELPLDFGTGPLIEHGNYLIPLHSFVGANIFLDQGAQGYQLTWAPRGFALYHLGCAGELTLEWDQGSSLFHVAKMSIARFPASPKNCSDVCPGHAIHPHEHKSGFLVFGPWLTIGTVHDGYELVVAGF